MSAADILKDRIFPLRLTSPNKPSCFPPLSGDYTLCALPRALPLQLRPASSIGKPRRSRSQKPRLPRGGLVPNPSGRCIPRSSVSGRTRLPAPFVAKQKTSSVIGSGPAAHTAAIYLARAELKRKRAMLRRESPALTRPSRTVRGLPRQWNRSGRTIDDDYRRRELSRIPRRY
jgi:hypothetical protein